MQLHHHKPPLPQPQRQTPDEVIDQLKDAVSANDVNAFCKQLSLLPSPYGNIHDLSPVMYEAVRQDCAAAVRELLRYGMDMRYTFAVAAIRAKAKDSLGVFLQQGWDVNAPISETEPTVFAYVYCGIPA